MKMNRNIASVAISVSLLVAALTVSIFPISQNGNSDEIDLSVIRSASADSTNQMFLSIDDIPGSSTNSQHSDEIDLLWYCFGYSSRSDIPGWNSDEGKSRFATNSFDGFHFVMTDSKATPKLLKAYLNQTKIDKVTFSVQRGSSLAVGSDYLTVNLSDVKVTSYFHASNREDFRMPIVEVSMTYSKIDMTYSEGGETVSEGWDFTTNKPV